MLNESWPMVKLDSITTKIGSGATPRGGKNSYKASGTSLIRSLNVYDFEFSYEDLAFIDTDQAEALSNVEVYSQDVLLNITGASVARCCMVPDKILPARVNQHVSIIRVQPDIADPNYVLYCLNSSYYKHQLLTLAQGGATREALTQETIRNFEILLPPLPIQRKIAAILSAYDDLIENNTRRIALLEQMAQLLYREWFVRFRFPGYESARMVASEVGEIPEGWEVKRLEEVCDLTMGQSPSSEFYNEVGEGLPFHQGVTDFGNWFPNTRVYCAQLNRIAEDGDILFSVRAPVGRINLADRRIVIVRGLSAIRSKTGNQVFLLQQLKEKFQEEDSIGGGTIFKAVTKSDMQAILLVIPSGKLVNEFEHIVKPILQQIKNLTSRNITLRRTRDLLLPRLISGEVDVAELEIAE